MASIIFKNTSKLYKTTTIFFSILRGILPIIFTLSSACWDFVIQWIGQYPPFSNMRSNFKAHQIQKISITVFHVHVMSNIHDQSVFSITTDFDHISSRNIDSRGWYREIQMIDESIITTWFWNVRIRFQMFGYL